MTAPPTTLLASDMDGTVIPLVDGEAQRREIAEFRNAVRRQPGLVLAYVTGRDLQLALDGIREYALPTPRILVCDVGTTVYVRERQRWIPDAEYRRKMKACLGGHTGDDVADALDGTLDLTPQEEARQGEFKRSYYLPLRADRKKLLARVQRRLSRRGIRTSLVYSMDRQKQVGLLDVLPASVAKDFALQYLQKKLDVDPSRVVYAGDSGNDFLAFTSGFKAIVVGNTPKPVKDMLRHRIKRKTALRNTVWFAQHKYAGGVLEGARHFGIFPR